MYVRHLAVRDFRSWAAADVAFAPGVSVLLGANGQGKTNLIEAIGYLATLGSHRVAADAPLVRAGQQRAVVQAAIVSAGRELRVELEITPGRANKAKLGGAPVPRPREILGALRWVLFAPEDLAIVRGDPAERRRFLDELAVALAPRVAGSQADYDRVLRQRAALLKSAGAARRSGAGPDLRTLDAWDAQLAGFGAEVLAARLDALRALAPHAVRAYERLAPGSAPLTLRYSSKIELSEIGAGGSGAVAPAGADVASLEAALLAELGRSRPAELDRGVNLVGPHRDDLELGIGDLPVRGYASHGEGWSVALALRLGCYDLLRERFGPDADPVLVLDDVFAELDAGRREQLALAASKAEQALVTAAVPSDVPELLGGTHYEVREGVVRRVG